ncbi:MAG: WbqC family protein [Bacteroidales bacterium]|jgi:hypothetical protein|nr:WbqC family protein [Bacteroidales bacterium]
MNKALFTSLYLAPIAYYKQLLSCDRVIIEQYNHYEKKTFQNRCEILSANGTIALSVPVEKNSQAKTPFKDIRIAYFTDWQKQHLRALMSAYQNSPFYEYYIDDLLPLYAKETKYLLDFNMGLQETILDIIEEPRPTSVTDSFYTNDDLIDHRFTYHPKQKLTATFKPYTQVFSDKTDFVPNLSILDLLFNLGPEVEMYLKG